MTDLHGNRLKKQVDPKCDEKECPPIPTVHDMENVLTRLDTAVDRLDAVVDAIINRAEAIGAKVPPNLKDI